MRACVTKGTSASARNEKRIQWNLIMELLLDIRKLGKDDVALAGGKGASLGEIMKAGISVPAGFVILSTAFDNFLETTHLNVEIDSI
jgi:phosphoenolpyruvate synthase/pyruvate phosphate dikinase